jgi:hypothetical protein
MDPAAYRCPRPRFLAITAAHVVPNKKFEHMSCYERSKLIESARALEMMVKVVTVLQLVGQMWAPPVSW